MGNIAINNNDDRILHCCLLYQCKVKGHDGRVVLFSNDVQLCSKALLNHVTALSRKASGRGTLGRCITCVAAMRCRGALIVRRLLAVCVGGGGGSPSTDELINHPLPNFV